MKSNKEQGIRIASCCSYLPKRILTNADLEKMVETTDEWITTRTGIKERHIAAENEFTSDMAAEASLKAIKKAGLTPEEIDLIIVATITPDAFFPSTSCYVQHKIGATHAAALDVVAACSGFLYGLVLAKQFISSGQYRNVLVIGAEKLTSIVNWKDRNTCVLFGDGAGAAVVQVDETGTSKIVSHRLGADGGCHEMLYLKSSHSFGKVGDDASTTFPTHHLEMSGKEVFKRAVNAMYHAAQDVMEEAGWSVEDLKCVITHQANIRIIEALRDKLKVPEEKCFVNVHKYGNISAACIPIALTEAEGHYGLKRGDKVLLVAFGGGLTWAAVALQW